jgi:hypothetical protein
MLIIGDGSLMDVWADHWGEGQRIGHAGDARDAGRLEPTNRRDTLLTLACFLLFIDTNP